MFRLLRADEIEVRVNTVNEKGCSLLLYKDARCDMNILDETVGAMNWMRSHSRNNANCIIHIWDEKKSQWIYKEDTGTESFTEKEKGLASDSFKRAGVNWGIGRELYTAPFIWVSATNVKIIQKNSKYTTNDKFTVGSISYDENRRIIGLVIQDQNGKTVYTFAAKNAPEQKHYCTVCGAEVNAVERNGKVTTAKEVYDACGGMCVKCYKAAQKKLKQE